MSDQDQELIAKQHEERDEQERKLARQIRRMERLSEAAGHAKWHAVRCPDG